MKLPILLSLILSIGIIVVILYFTFDVETLNYLGSHSLRYEFFALAILVNFLYWIVWGLRQKVLSNSIDSKVQIGLWESTKIILANLFLANITPSMAGGEPVRIHLLTKNGLSTGSATAVVLSGRMLDAIFLLICVPFALYIFQNTISLRYLQAGLIIAVVVFFVVVLFFLYAIKKPDHTKRFLIYLGSKFSRKTSKENLLVKRINKEVDNFHQSMVFFLTEGRVAFLKAFGVTALFWAVGWLIPPLLLLGLGLQPHWIDVIAAQSLLVIIVMMPTTPGSAGVTEGGFAALYSPFIAASFLGVFVLLYRMITYYLGLVVGAVFQYRIFKSVFSFSFDSLEKHGDESK